MLMIRLDSLSPSAIENLASLAWVMLLGSTILGCLIVRSQFIKIVRAGLSAELLGHFIVGYFSTSMMAFGTWASANAYFPVPGGFSWTGGLAVVGGVAAAITGAATLIEHLADLPDMARERAMVAVSIPVDNAVSS